jgi:hypothetical protein
MARTFTENIKFWLPSWLGGAGSSGTDDEKVAGSLGLMLDDYAARARFGLLSRFPGVAVYLDDEAALAAIGRDRRITRGINEPAAAYAVRLKRALDDHHTRGNPYTMLAQLQAYLQAPCVVRTVDRRGNWYSIDGDGNRSSSLNTGNWEWDELGPEDWSRFWVIIYPVGGTDPWAVSGAWGAPTLYGDGTFGNAGKDPKYTFGTTATPDQVASVRAIIRDWKPAGTTCEWILIAFDDATFTPDGATDPAGEWGTWSNGTGGPVRLDTARYWKGPTS